MTGDNDGIDEGVFDTAKKGLEDAEDAEGTTPKAESTEPDNSTTNHEPKPTDTPVHSSSNGPSVATTDSDQTPTAPQADSNPTSTDDGELSKEDMPHKFYRNSPKDDRLSKNIYFAPEDLRMISDLEALAKDHYGEKAVSRLDVYLAAFRSDLSNEGFIEEMEKIGYGNWD